MCEKLSKLRDFIRDANILIGPQKFTREVYITNAYNRIFYNDHDLRDNVLFGFTRLTLNPDNLIHSNDNYFAINATTNEELDKKIKSYEIEVTELRNATNDKKKYK